MQKTIYESMWQVLYILREFAKTDQYIIFSHGFEFCSLEQIKLGPEGWL